MKVRLGFKTINLEVEGEPLAAKDSVTNKAHDDLTTRRRWHKEGYTITKFLHEGVYLQFYYGLEDIFKKCLDRAGLHVPKDFKIHQYHELVNGQHDTHQKVIEQIGLLPWYLLPIHIQNIEERVSEIISIPVKSQKSADGQRVFNFSVVRPCQADSMPLHRDAWNEEEYKDAINLYLPLAYGGKSTLLVAPGSHQWPEHRLTRTSQGAVMNGVKWNMPGLMESEMPVTLIRPTPGHNQVMVYSPHLIQGTLVNRNKNATGISFVMRFWRKE